MKAGLLALAALFSTLTVAAPVEMKVKSSEVKYFANADLKVVSISFEGTGPKIYGTATVDGDVLTGRFWITLAQFSSDDGTRDGHMREVFWAKKHPKVVLDITQARASGGAFIGKLTLRGVTKNVNGKFTRDGKTATGSMTINIRDFGVKKADIDKTVMGFDIATVKPEVKIEFKATME